jgi:DNA adenine methylase
MFDKKDFERLAGLLGSIKGRFILSINDVPEIREIFAAFKIEMVQTTYSLSRHNRTKVGELIISNYE